ncbi:hypothetical protein N7474_007918 [Penicillium riverlandense]|uniref:uncharacterized protein n=1 Tax=Penicillium riverlandense TaxID=1903569 RepID=UPI0025466BF8|nr:uncharacterized protein N7474_007918 [Penicillium riverlandense]KAJ5811617.1 hypothetical protein N7474_007918 [Penicillium riverlandense]
MVPKAASSKEKGDPATPKKDVSGTPKAPKAPKVPKTPKSEDKDLQFLWTCIQNTGPNGSVNYKAVADVYGIKIPTCRMRFTRLKARLEGMPKTVPEDDGVAATEGEGQTDADGSTSPTFEDIMREVMQEE